MFQIYPKYLKKQLCEEVCIQGKSTLKTATESIQQKFLPYDDLSKEELRKILMLKDIEIARLKKSCLVKGSGQNKEFVSFSKKNTK